MAEPLGQVVFKVPELGKMGYELELRDQAMQEKKAQRRESEVYRTGGEKAYSDNVYKLQGRYKEDAELLYNKLEEYGTKYEMTGDASALRMVNQLSGQIKGIVNDYNTQIGTAINSASKADEKGWEGYVGDRSSFDEQISSVLNPSDITGRKFENGQLLYQINGEWTPRSQTDYGSQSPNSKNTVLVQEASNMGKYVVPSYYESQNKFLAINASSAESASNSIINEFRYEYPNNPELQADAAVAYAIKARGLDPKNISVTEMNKIIARFQNDEVFRKQALDFYEQKLGKVAANRWASQQSGLVVNQIPREGEGQETVVDAETPAEETVTEGKEETSTETTANTNIKIPETKFPTVAEKQEPAPQSPSTPPQQPKAQGGQAQFGPPSPEQVIEKAAEEIQDVELEDVPETEEEFDPQFGINEQTLDVVRVTKGENGKPDVVSIKRTLPEIYTNNLLKFEGGISSDESDPAYGDNPTAPVVNGERIHTNIGVTWNVYKSWAKAFGIPEADMESRFLNLKPNEALAVAEHIAETKGSNNFKNPALIGLFTQNAWGGGGVLGKTEGSPEYQATISMLEANGIKLSSKHRISKEDAANIEELYNKNPKKFLDDYFDAYMVSHSRMDKIVHDTKGYAGFGKGAYVPLYMVYRNGWMSRANNLKKEMAKNAGVEYTPVTPYNKIREYQKSEKNGKTVWTLVEKRDGQWTPVGRNDWVKSLEPIK